VAASSPARGATCSRAIPTAFCSADTWINERWFAYDGIMKAYREWLAQLPDDQARRIAHGNAERLFNAKVE
jgi:hypothetical protein